jgi:hypothetical protein
MRHLLGAPDRVNPSGEQSERAGSAPSLRYGTVLVFEFDDCAAAGRRLQQVECRPDDASLRDVTPRWTERASHRMTRHHRAWIAHLGGDVGERAHHHGDRGKALGLRFAGDVSDRHVAHGSDGNEEERLDSRCPPMFDPTWRLTSDPALCTRSDEREEVVEQTPDEAVLLRLDEVGAGKGHARIA